MGNVSVNTRVNSFFQLLYCSMMGAEHAYNKKCLCISFLRICVLRMFYCVQRLAGATLLVFANKQDLPGAMSAEEIKTVSFDLLFSRYSDSVVPTACTYRRSGSLRRSKLSSV